MPQLTLALSADESLDVLREIVESDQYIESLETKLGNAKAEAKFLREALKDAVIRRGALSLRAREGATVVDEPAASAPRAGDLDDDDEDGATDNEHDADLDDDDQADDRDDADDDQTGEWPDSDGAATIRHPAVKGRRTG